MKTTCPYCGTTLKEIRESGFVGCEHCYTQIDEVRKIAIDLFDGKLYTGRAPIGRDHE